MFGMLSGFVAVDLSGRLALTGCLGPVVGLLTGLNVPCSSKRLFFWNEFGVFCIVGVEGWFGLGGNDIVGL